MFSLSPHNALYPLVLNSSLNCVIEQDVAAITAAFRTYILVGESLYCSEAVVAAFLDAPLLSAARCARPLACGPPWYAPQYFRCFLFVLLARVLP